MARNLDPKHKICRKYGQKLCDNFKCPVTKRNYPPGQHGPRKIRGKMSDFGRQLREKQKAKYMYGLLEQQFKNTFLRARKLPGHTGTNLLLLLEKRLDNIVYRAGFASTKRLARQLVNHGHFDVDGVKTDIPSYIVSPGEVITVRINKADTAYWKGVAESFKKNVAPSWLSPKIEDLSIAVLADPKQEELPQNLETQLIVEYYSR